MTREEKWPGQGLRTSYSAVEAAKDRVLLSPIADYRVLALKVPGLKSNGAGGGKSGTGWVRKEGSEAAQLTSSSRAGPPRRAGGSVFGRRVLRGRPPGGGPTRLSPLACLLRPRETARQESLAALSSCCEGSSKLLSRWRTTSSWKVEQTRSFACCCDESCGEGRGGRPREKDVVGGRRRRDGSQPTLLGGLYSREPTSREAARLHDTMN